MTRKVLIENLISLPHEIYAAEQRQIECKEILAEAKDHLADVEAYLLLAPDSPICKKNAELRAASIRDLTGKERQAVTDAERAVLVASLETRLTFNRFRSMLAISALLAGTKEPPMDWRGDDE